MVDITQPTIVNPRTGNISQHGRAALLLTIEFEDENAALINVSGWSLFFEIEDGLRLALGAGSAVHERTLTVTRAQIARLAGKVRLFALVDENAAVPTVHWEGELRIHGFTDQPVATS